MVSFFSDAKIPMACVVEKQKQNIHIHQKGLRKLDVGIRNQYTNFSHVHRDMNNQGFQGTFKHSVPSMINTGIRPGY